MGLDTPSPSRKNASIFSLIKVPNLNMCPTSMA